jgi:hypothetical protein
MANGRMEAPVGCPLCDHPRKYLDVSGLRIHLVRTHAELTVRERSLAISRVRWGR